MKDRKWNGKDRATLLMRLSVLLSNGYTISSAIELLSFSVGNDTRKRLLQKIIDDLRDGNSVHQAFEHLNLPKDIIAYLYFSEANGNLTQGLQQAGTLYFKRELMKEKLLKLLRYPIFLLWIVTILALIMVSNLFPQFEQIYSSVSVDLPLLTTLFLQFINLLPFFLIIVVITFIFLFLYYWVHIRRWTPHKKVALLLKIPYVATILRMLITYYFSLQLSGLLNGGLKIYDALAVFCKQDRLPFFKDEAEVLIRLLQQGESFSDAVNSREHFLCELTNVIRHGEQQSQLNKELMMYSNILFERLEEKTKSFIMIVQPTLFFVIGLIVLVMFLAIFLPMLDLIHSIQ